MPRLMVLWEQTCCTYALVSVMNFIITSQFKTNVSRKMHHTRNTKNEYYYNPSKNDVDNSKSVPNISTERKFAKVENWTKFKPD